jgi:UDP-N-acetylglucosamine--dolichyl-phosphate N-acetylglucosaminephosphotransferase
MVHTYLTLLVPAVSTFVVTVIAILFIKPYMLESGVTIIDHNKKPKSILPSSGGVAVAFGFTAGMLAYIFGSSFSFYTPVASLESLFATVLAVLLIAFGGFLDDINVQKKATRTTDLIDTHKGLKQWQKPLLSLIGAIPLVAINAGVSVIRIPFVGAFNFGLFYPLVIIPLAVIFASNSFNLLGGFDGISAGSGLIMSLGMLIYSLVFGTYTGALISGILFASILAFMLFNVYPASLIGGDSFSYFVGGALVSAMVIGSMESFGVVIFMPFIIEFVLHARRKFKVTDLGKRRSDGTFDSPYGRRIYSWTHVIMNLRRMNEWEVSLCMWLIEIGFVIIAFAMKLFLLL